MKTKAPTWFFVALGLIVAAACVAWWLLETTVGAAHAAGPRRLREPGAVDVVVIVIDTERADYTSAYGAALPTTPILERIAAQGIRFEHVFSPAPWTVPAMFSMFTGLYPSEHGMIQSDNTKLSSPHALSEDAVTLTELLKDAGYSTFGINTNFTLQPRFGFAQGFDHFVGKDFAFLPFPNLALEAMLPDILRAKKLFLWMHYFDPHQPYRLHYPWFDTWNDSEFHTYPDLLGDLGMRLYRQYLGLGPNDPIRPEHVDAFYKILAAASSGPPLGKVYQAFRAAPIAGLIPEEYRKFMKAAYRSDIRETDKAMGEALVRMGVDDRTIVVVTADHGEELFEHGRLGHHHNALYQELLSVPLVIRLPGGKGAGTVIDTPVSTMDLVPTLLDLLGLPIPAGLSGVSLRPLIEERPFAPRALFAEVNSLDGNSRAIIDYPWKYIYNLKTHRAELFDLDEDPGERHNLVKKERKRAEMLHGRLAEWLRQARPRWPDAPKVKLTPDDILKLQHMGYIR